MKKMLIREIPVNARVEILGHTFSGLIEIKQAVATYARVMNSTFGRHVFTVEPRKPVPGLHVLNLFEPYPCFDSDDYASEDRDYCNFFFSRKPFEKADIERLSRIKKGFNNCLVNDNTPLEALPAVYYKGDGPVMLLAVEEE